MLANMMMSLLALGASTIIDVTEPYIPEQPGEGNLKITVLWDPEDDSFYEGIGPGRLVVVDEYGEDPTYFAATDPDSSVTLHLPYGLYIVYAYPEDDQPFYDWACHIGVHLDQPNETHIIECEKVFASWIPLLGKEID